MVTPDGRSIFLYLASNVSDDGKPLLDSNQDPTLVDVAQKAQAEANGSTARDFFHWQPKNLMQEYMVDKKNPEAQSKLFHHMTNYAAQMMWDSKKKLQPSAWFGRQHVRG